LVKSLRKMYPCDEGLTCVVDDRVDVWREHQDNVLRAHEYMYFSGKGEMNARPGAEKKGDVGNGKQQNLGVGAMLPPIRSKGPEELEADLASRASSAAPPSAASAAPASPSAA